MYRKKREGRGHPMGEGHPMEEEHPKGEDHPMEEEHPKGEDHPMEEERPVDVERLLAQGKTIQLKPIGYSMYPLIVPGRDEAVIAPMGGRVPRRGDVVLYRRGGSILVLHRIWKRKGKMFYMVGDNQREIEGPLGREQIKGILVGIVRDGKRFSAKNPLYRAGAGLWLLLRPLRPVLSRIAAAWRRRVR